MYIRDDCMKKECVTCGIVSDIRRDFFTLAGSAGNTDICKKCAAEIGITNFFKAGLTNNTKAIKKYVEIHPEAQGKLDNQKKILEKNKEEFKIELNEIKTKLVEKANDASLEKKKEMKCTCVSCGKVYYYGDAEVLRNTVNALNFSIYSINQLKDLNRCPKCGSRAVKKEEVSFLVDKKGNFVKMI